MIPIDMATLHRRAFEPQARAWRVAEFEQVLADPQILCVGDERAFALARVVGDEAEVLTLACDPDFQRQGLGAACFHQLMAAAQASGVRRIFLEVAADNHPALALYSKMAFTQVGRRASYYRRTGGVGVDALVLQKVLAVSF